MKHKIHIGQLIRASMTSKGCSITWLANQMNRDRSHIHRIINRPTIDTGELSQIGELLDFNFFTLYCQEKQETDDTLPTKDFSV
ncbi:MAG: hypothetical protein LBL18_00535 [Bacteroidales bacterium]|jgi:plasmid maintenance system antidote protein VapI|nr:hypothetical protein [Bacteroidales bacterium]